MEILKNQLIRKIKNSGKLYYKNLEDKSIEELRMCLYEIRETKEIKKAWDKAMSGKVEEYGWGMRGQEDIETYFIYEEE